MSNIIIQLSQVALGYSARRLITNINWRIIQGQHWVITGRNASGKTTLAKAIAGRVRLLEGRMEIPMMKALQYSKAEKTAIQLVSFTDEGKHFRSVNADHYYQQRYNAFDADGHLTVRSYLADAGLKAADSYGSRMVSQLDLAPLLDTDRIKLSSGQTRKLILCKALLMRPKILILDNPHIGLDPESRDRLNQQLDKLISQTDTTLILAGHFKSLPSCISHQIELGKGTVQYCHRLQSLANGSNGVPSHPLGLLPNLVPAYREAAMDPHKGLIISCQDVSVKYGKKIILQNLNWTVSPGDKWAITGNNGAGKSTLLSLIYADHPQAYANKISVFGKRRGSGESIWQIKKKIGFTSAELHAYFRYDFTGRDVVLSGLWDGFFVKSPTQNAAQLLRLFFHYFNLDSIQDAPYHTLSTGTQRLLFLMRALIKSPPLLLLDEPFQGLDEENIRKCKTLLDHILDDDESTLIFITHYKSKIPDIVNQYLDLPSP